MNLCQGATVPKPTTSALEQAEKYGLDADAVMAGAIHLVLHPLADPKAVAREVWRRSGKTLPAASA